MSRWFPQCPPAPELVPACSCYVCMVVCLCCWLVRAPHVLDLGFGPLLRLGRLGCWPVFGVGLHLCVCLSRSPAPHNLACAPFAATSVRTENCVSGKAGSSAVDLPHVAQAIDGDCSKQHVRALHENSCNSVQRDWCSTLPVSRDHIWAPTPAAFSG